MGYNPRATWEVSTSSIPQVNTRLEQITEARQLAYEAWKQVEETWRCPTRRPQWQYKEGDQVWLEGTNICTSHPTAKLAPKCHGPFQITKVLGPVTYQLQLPDQWQIHPVFHVDLLMPYKEMTTHGANYTRPPPDLINGEEEYEVERVINSQQFGRGRQVQYLVKWKGYPDSDNQWIKWQDVNAPDLIVECQRENPDAITHIRRGWYYDESITTPSPSILSPISHLLPHMSSASDALSPSAMAFEIERSGIDPTDGSAFIRVAQAIYRRQRQEGPHRGGDGERDNSDSDAQIPNDLAISDTDVSGEVPSGQMARDGANTPPSHDDGVQPLTNNGLRPFLVPAPEDEQSPNPTPIDTEDDALTYPENQPEHIPTRPNTPGPLASYPIQHDQIMLATIEGVQTPHVTTTSGEALYHHNLWTVQTATDGTIHEVPSGFRRNTGRDYVPFLIIDKDGELHQADFVQVVLSRDPLVLAIREGDPHLYGSALHATPYYDGEEYRPHYDHWGLATLERRYQGSRKTDRAIRELKDVTLITEVE